MNPEAEADLLEDALEIPGISVGFEGSGGFENRENLREKLFRNVGSPIWIFDYPRKAG